MELVTGAMGASSSNWASCSSRSTAFRRASRRRSSLCHGSSGSCTPGSFLFHVSLVGHAEELHARAGSSAMAASSPATCGLQRDPPHPAIPELVLSTVKSGELYRRTQGRRPTAAAPLPRDRGGRSRPRLPQEKSFVTATAPIQESKDYRYPSRHQTRTRL
ncbi:unnamed protein product [Miscanthus lutarioriparius]|uniref:Uncharacterized protein n=1 Tax=Miscanthus lutarioriparius TaxID=422564 RepID=A0A811SBZ8_9POAL|nr:unnamed protein product [Miscanthus lutarioriparius]